ncbi:single-stranded-DNA-specific exonuclease RecJ [Cohnella silvisoli]|uniref:Single-stranded-DNA-specific exonuclease RecJ n=1 Tax=Cohnella silvisoli TaxID=2873699 RepID=A0ABV1KP14_9BACL|nr:single-stranded-DNA-specific exonuclease RecJ [Cohnella silvisoli]MCD9025671.1 single-stranded-DNA-specific exonuclease RecJ [Cohnella silvisoli]
MIKSKYRWDLPSLDEEQVAALMKGLNVSRLAAGVLSARGWSSLEQTSAFLEADAWQLLDPFEMKGMKEAVGRISYAITSGERIRVYGDYDADGVSSTALMIRLLTELGANFDTYIPHRSREGYGLNLGAIDKAAEAGVNLLITVDNGISAVDQIAYAAQQGIDVVVTDHHEPPEVLPEAAALVNPKQKDCPYPFKGLCGAGVVFKLAHAMLGRPVLEYADLAAIGTIADLMPLTGENRVIARLGLEQMRRSPIVGIRALAKVSGVKPEDLTSGRIGFSLAPRLNAGGRLDHADRAVKLLAAVAEEEAELLANELDGLNVERQELVEQTVIEADSMWQSCCSAAGDRPMNVIVLAKAGWNAGIAGLVASKLVERYYQPVIILATDSETGLCKGSARSIDGFDLYAALTECTDLMEHYGGHQAAAGMTISQDKLGELSERLHILADQWLSAEHWQPKRRVDLSISLQDITLKAIEQLARLEPFGNGNPTPRIVIQDVLIRESRTMGKESKHLRITIEQAGQTIEAVGFGMGEYRDRLAPGIRVDLLGELSVNEWNGNRKAQLMFQDFRSQHLQLNDRRKERNWWPAVESLVMNQPSGLVIGCASTALLREATSRFGHAEIPISLYTDSWIDIRTVTQTAASSELRANPLSDWRHLIMLGFPANDQEVRTLKQWLAPERGGEVVTLFHEVGDARQAGDIVPAFPERKHFAEIYGMCRKRGAWLDSPEGFVQETASLTGWPLSTLRMVHEVFIELGFIAADGASRKIVAEPPRRELDDSTRYRKAREQFDGLRLAHMTTEELHLWFSACHSTSV